MLKDEELVMRDTGTGRPTTSWGSAAAAAAFFLCASLAPTVACSQDSVPALQHMTAAEFDEMFKAHSNWGRWGEDDQLGALNLVTAEKRRQAAALVRSGVSVSLSHNPMTEEALDNSPVPFEHVMGEGLRTDTYRFRYHGYGLSHIDALCHFSHNDMMYNGVPTNASTEKGCSKLGIEHLKDGVVARGVLIDIARLKSVPYMDPSVPIYVEDIEAWEEMAGVTVAAGDVLLLRVGRWARRDAVGPWFPRDAIAGFHTSVGPWLKARDVAVIGSDASTDVQPSGVEGMRLPLHTFLIAGLGITMLDNMDLEALAETAARENRWEFMVTIAPIPVTGGTGSPVNVLAIF